MAYRPTRRPSSAAAGSPTTDATTASKGVFEKPIGILCLGQERFNVALQLLVVTAGNRDERRTVSWLAIESGLEDLFDAAPAVILGHADSLPATSRAPASPSSARSSHS